MKNIKSVFNTPLNNSYFIALFCTNCAVLIAITLILVESAVNAL